MKIQELNVCVPLSVFFSGFGGGKRCGKRSLRWRLGLTWVVDDQGFIRRYYPGDEMAFEAEMTVVKYFISTPGGGRTRGNDRFRSISV